MNRILEICCADIESVDAAVRGGADRIELCCALSEGGVTPSAGLIAEAVSRNVPINVLIRPRSGDFAYSSDEINVMLRDISLAAAFGANGVVIGALLPNGSIDVKACRRMTEAAKEKGLSVTFHRAFDMCSNAMEALEDVVSTGADRILTSGLASTALNGADLLAKLNNAAAGRITIMAGCGVTPDNISEIIQRTGVTEVHASAKTTKQSSMTFRNETAKMGKADADEYARTVTSETNVAQLANIIHN